MTAAATATASDWQLVADYLNDRSGFIDPIKFNTLRQRGLAWVINDIGGNESEQQVAQALATAYGRLKKAGKVFGDEEIDEISHHVQAVGRIQADIAKAEPTDCTRLLPWSKS